MNSVQLNPDFPAEEGFYQMTKNWSINLPGNFNRRFEDDSLVFWRPGFTIWIIIWGNDRNESPLERKNKIKEEATIEKYDEKEINGNVLLYSYRNDEVRGEEKVYSLSCFAFGSTGHVQMSIYFDKESDLNWSNLICKSLSETIEE